MFSLKKLSFVLLAGSFVFTSCADADAPQSQVSYEVPANYSFLRNGTTTVDFSGQTARLFMLDEMGNYLRTQATAGLLVQSSILSSMYANTDAVFSSSFLNESGKTLRDKTAASTDYFSLNFGGGSVAEQNQVRMFFASTFVDAQNASTGSVASQGVAGTYIDGTSTRLFAANGLEPQQIYLKGLMGAVMLDQIVNNYLSVYKLDEGLNRQNNTDKVLESGKNYTAMEHNWDEAYGYIYGADSDSPVVLKFWSSYIAQVNDDADFNTLAADISLAFRKGRAAITANDYNTRDAQIAAIRSKLAMVLAVRTVFYLQEGKAQLGVDNGAKAFHALSEAYGFMMSLRYTNKPGTDGPYFSKVEVENMLASMDNGTGFWQIDPAVLEALSVQIATRFGFTEQQASTVN